MTTEQKRDALATAWIKMQSLADAGRHVAAEQAKFEYWALKATFGLNRFQTL